MSAACRRYHNASGPPDAEVVVPTLATLLSLKGTKAAPVRAGGKLFVFQISRNVNHER